jgi:hypothetical protein
VGIVGEVKAKSTKLAQPQNVKDEQRMPADMVKNAKAKGRRKHGKARSLREHQQAEAQRYLPEQKE